MARSLYSMFVGIYFSPAFSFAFLFGGFIHQLSPKGSLAAPHLELMERRCLSQYSSTSPEAGVLVYVGSRGGPWPSLWLWLASLGLGTHPWSLALMRPKAPHGQVGRGGSPGEKEVLLLGEGKMNYSWENKIPSIIGKHYCASFRW